MMQGIEIGEIELVPREDRRMMVIMPPGHEYSWWTVEGAQQAIAYL